MQITINAIAMRRIVEWLCISLLNPNSMANSTPTLGQHPWANTWQICLKYLVFTLHLTLSKLQDTIYNYVLSVWRGFVRNVNVPE